MVWVPNDRLTGLATVRQNLLYRDEQTRGTGSRSDGSLGETWLRWHDALGRGVDLQVGRQDFDDEREWIYDQNLDAVRLWVQRDRWECDLAVSTTLADGDRRDREATNLSAYLSNGSRDRHLATYAVYRDIDGPEDERPLHLGLRALGEWLPDQDLWLDLALLRGERAEADLSAHAVDLGTTWTPDWAGPLSFTAGYALASGDDAPGSTDRGFRQTGLQDNNAKFDGVTSFRYYGELIDPELANLRVWTAGVGARLAEGTSLDLIFHHYRQDVAVDDLIDAELDLDPSGNDADLGTEVDLILGSRRWDNWDLELVLAWFRPGDAFPQADDAFLGAFQVRYRF